MMRTVRLFGCVLGMAAASVAGAAPGAGKGAGRAAQIEAMTGARTKIVWQHKVTAGPAKGWDAVSKDYELTVYDTAEGAERVLLPGPANFSNPCITKDGTRVVFSDGPGGKVYVVDWDGGNKRLLCKGFALDTWQDPKTRAQWVYVGDGMYGSRVFRVRLDDPKVREPVWDGPHSSRFRVSADGTRAGGEFSWPNAGVALLTGKSWKQYGNGCNGSLSPDNSYRLMHMGEKAGHNGVMMYDPGGTNKRTIIFRNFPGRGRQSSWVPRWTTDVRFLTVSSPIGGKKQQVYIGEFDVKYTRVTRWVQVSSRPGQNVYAHAWIDPGLGYHTGEVPLTVSFSPPAGGGQWRWDYGEKGAGDTGTAGKHTYGKGGKFRVTARQGKKTVVGWVQTSPADRPRVTAVRMQDEAHLQVAFSERVRLRDAKVALASGKPVTGWKLDSMGLALVVTLGGQVGEDDSLVLEGVVDLAQSPNPLVGKSFAISRPAWPGVRADLTFLWETVKKPSFQYHAASGEFTDTKIVIEGSARYDRNGAMLLAGGVIFAVDGGQGITARCGKTGQLTIEAVIMPANVHQGFKDKPRSIVSCGSGGRPRSVNFMLGQERGKLVLYLRNRPPKSRRDSVDRVELCDLSAEVPNHVVVTYKPGELTCYLNGKRTVSTDKVTGKLTWRKPPFKTGLNFGGVKPEASMVVGWGQHGAPERMDPWRGRLEGVAVYARAVSASDASRSAAAYAKTIAARPKVARITVRGKLVAKSRTPSAAKIAPYRDALAVFEYDVQDVLSGRYAHKKIRVARWALKDARPTALARAKPGDLAEMVVETWASNPQLEAEVLSDTLADDFDLPLHVDTANGPTGKPRLTTLIIHPREAWMPPGRKVQYEAEKLDQYRGPIDVPIEWQLIGGGRVNTGAHYGGGGMLEHRRDKATGSIGSGGLFTSDGSMGVVTVRASGRGATPVVGSAVLAVDNYPSISPRRGKAMHFGADGGGRNEFIGDIDRIRIYKVALSDERLAAHAKGKGKGNGRKLTDKGLVGDWTFDKLVEGKFPNLVAKGLVGKIVGEVKHVTDGDGGHIKVSRKWGYVEVAPDRRLNMSKACTLEAWIRPKKVPQAGTVIDKSQGGTTSGFRMMAGGGLRSKGLFGHGWLGVGYRYPDDAWTHIAAVYDVAGVRKLYVNGKLVGNRQLDVIVVIK